MSTWDWAKYAINPLYGLYDDRGKIADWANKRSNVPQIGANPYQQDWTGLVNQLKQTASGRGPSVAQGAYQAAHDQGMNDIQSMARGGSSGGARASLNAMGNMNTSMTQGL